MRAINAMQNCSIKNAEADLPAYEDDDRNRLLKRIFQTTALNSRRRWHGSPRHRHDKHPKDEFHI